MGRKKYGNITVRICSFNRASYLREALLSVLSQTLSAKRIEIFDNASDSAVHDGIADLLSSSVIWNSTAKNIGGTLNIQRAFRAAKTEYLYVMHDDDRLLPEFIERQIEFLDQNPDCVAISCNASFITPEGEQTQQKWFSPTEPDAIYKTKADLAALYATKFLGFPSFVYRAPLAQDITFRQELGKVSDVGLIIDLAEFGSIAFQNKTLLEYRAHENQDSAYFPEKTIKELFDFLNSFLPDNKAMHRDMEKAYRDRLIETLMKNLLRGKSGLSEISWIIQVHRPKILFSLAIMLGMKIMKKIWRTLFHLRRT